MEEIVTTEVFETIKQDIKGVEYWSARDLMPVLGYKDWRNFIKVINKAQESCKNSNRSIHDHFVDISKMVTLGSGAKRKVDDVLLTRYACYLIIQNADSSKEVIALAQTYFAIQTRKQELLEEADLMSDMSEDQKRLYLREEMKEHNKQLVDTAKKAGVETSIDYANFQNHGYRGLYNGMNASDIHRHKGLKKNEKILDHMGSTELAANLFRATQTEEKIRREKIKGKHNANRTHYEVGTKVRQTIKELGGVMPENLPTAKSITKINKAKIEDYIAKQKKGE